MKNYVEISLSVNSVLALPTKFSIHVPYEQTRILIKFRVCNLNINFFKAFESEKSFGKNTKL